jgi:Mg2+/Co2+ transporter CorC
MRVRRRILRGFWGRMRIREGRRAGIVDWDRREDLEEVMQIPEREKRDLLSVRVICWR